MCWDALRQFIANKSVMPSLINTRHVDLICAAAQIEPAVCIIYSCLCSPQVDKSPEGQFIQLMALPRTLQQKITKLVDPPGKNRDVEEILLQVAQDPDCGDFVQQGSEGCRTEEKMSCCRMSEGEAGIERGIDERRQAQLSN